MIWVLGLFLFHSFFTVKFEFIVLSLLYLGQVRVKPWKFASFCQALPLHAHSSLKWKSFLTNVMLHKGVYSLHTYNYSTWCRTPTKKTRSPPHWGLLDMNICHLNKCHQVHQFEDFTWPHRIGEKKKKLYFQVDGMTSVWMTDAWAIRVLSTVFQWESDHLQKTLPNTINEAFFLLWKALFISFNPHLSGTEDEKYERDEYVKIRQP